MQGFYYTPTQWTVVVLSPIRHARFLCDLSLNPFHTDMVNMDRF